MRPIIALVGRSNSGKTMLLEKLIPALEEEGLSSWRHQTYHRPISLGQRGQGQLALCPSGGKDRCLFHPRWICPDALCSVGPE
ncbi:MAG: molybdopterin-guanine dinucleotide biosynthesis protein MobB [Limnochordia bacterium]